MKGNGEERLLTVREAAEFLGVCQDTLYGWCARAQVPHYRLRPGGRGPIRFRRSELEAHLGNGLKGPAPAPPPRRPKAGERLRHLR